MRARVPPFRTVVAFLVAAVAVAGFAAVGVAADTAESLERERLYVAAAASLTDAVERLEAEYEATHRGVDIVPTFAGSSTLARQIEGGAPFDVFLSADVAWVEYLAPLGLLAEAPPWALRNELVMVGIPERIPTGWDDLEGLQRLALADPDAVPAGRYARAALEDLGLWTTLAERVVSAGDVRAALAYAARGEVDAAMVYRTDATAASVSLAVLPVPPRAQPTIRYGLATLTSSAAPEAAADFARYLDGPTARAVFAELGFSFADASASPPAADSAAGVTLVDRRGGAGSVGESGDLGVIALSMWVALAATALVVPFGVLVGWLLARRRFVGRSALEHASNLPLVLPPAVTGFLLLWLLGGNGIIGRHFASVGVRLAFTTFAAVLAAAVVAFPLMVQSVRVAIEGLDPAIEDAARTLGASPLRVFGTVTLPLALPGIAGGAVIAFARALGELGATLVFAGNIAGETRTIPLAVWTRVNQIGGEASALRLVIVSVAIAYGSLLLSSWFQRRMRSRAGTS